MPDVDPARDAPAPTDASRSAWSLIGYLMVGATTGGVLIALAAKVLLVLALIVLAVVLLLLGL